MKKFLRQLIATCTAIVIIICPLAGEVIPVWAQETVSPEENVILDETAGSDETEEILLTPEEDVPAIMYGDGDHKQMVIENGMAQPIIDYRQNTVISGWEYSNTYTDAEGVERLKDIIRFCVYVETDLDTDMDGKRDLVQALIQVPAAAAQGDYKAPTLFHASPYMAGCSDKQLADRFNRDLTEEALDGFQESDLYHEVAKREPASGPVSSTYAARETNVNDWYYAYDKLQDDKELKGYYYLWSLHDHDYFLVRGFAVVLSAGLGTNGSEGLETCGSAAERDAFADIIEWIHGDRVAYTDKENRIPIEADWANGKVAMEGLSYDGTMAYEVATTGVEGLETVVPEGAISSWYDYSNTQGESLYYDGSKPKDYDYTSGLAGFCASRFYGRDPAADAEKTAIYNKFLSYCRIEQMKLKGAYGDYWAGRDHSKPDKLKASALIVHGLNDYNVTTKQTDLMLKAFQDNHCDAKVLLHRGAHELPDTIRIGDYYYNELLNLWFCHYLLDIDNHVSDIIPDLWVQSNVNGEFEEVNKWGADATLTMESAESGQTYIKPAEDDRQNGSHTGIQVPGPGVNEPDPSRNAYYTIDDFFASRGETYGPVMTDEEEFIANTFDGTEEGQGQDYGFVGKRVNEDVTISGSVKVHVKLAVSDVDSNVIMAGVILNDVSDGNFNAYVPVDGSIFRNSFKNDIIEQGGGLGFTIRQEFKQDRVSHAMISKGMINLKMPDAKYAPETAKAPATPIEENEYYEYDIYLIPTVYTVKKGHHLELFIMTDQNGIKSQSGFWIDNESTSVEIPLSPAPGGGGVDPDRPVSSVPEASRPSGEVPKGTRILLSCATPDAEIYYTTDGTAPGLDPDGYPSGATRKYEDAIVINDATEIKAVSAVDGYVSSGEVGYEYSVAQDWKDITDDAIKNLFGNDPDNVPRGMWYYIDGTDRIYENSGPIDCTLKFTGDKLTFNESIRVYYRTSRLWENRDYTVSYTNTTKAATADSAKPPTVTVKGNGNYGGSAVFRFNIEPLLIDGGSVVISSEKDVCVTAGTTLGTVKPVISNIINGEKKLALNKDYTLQYFKVVADILQPASPNDKCEAGAAYKVKIVAADQSDYTGEMPGQVSVQVADPKDRSVINMKNVRVTIPKQSHKDEAINVVGLFDNSGGKVAPATVKSGAKTLVYNTDFYVDAASYQEAGKYPVVLHGCGNARGTKTAVLEITGTVPVNTVRIAGLSTICEYTGKPVTLDDLYKKDNTGFNKVTLYYTDAGMKKTLTEGTDYEVEMPNTGAKGSFKLSFILKGAYSGKITKTITVKPYNIMKNAGDRFTLTTTTATFRKSGAIPKVTVTDGARTLEEGVDYKLAYSNNAKVALATDKGAPVVTVTGLGNYTGSCKKTFTVTKAVWSNIVMLVPDKEYKDKAAKGYFKSTPRLVDCGKAVTAGKNKDIEPLARSAYKYYYAVSGEEIPDTDVVPRNALIEVRVTVTCSPESPYNRTNDPVAYEVRGYYRMIDKTKNIAKANVSVKDPASMMFANGEPLVPLKSEDLKVMLNQDELAPSSYEILSVTNNRFLGTAGVELKGRGEYGGTKIFTFKIKAKNMTGN